MLTFISGAEAELDKQEHQRPHVHIQTRDTDALQHVKGSLQENFQRIPPFPKKARLLLQKQGRILLLIQSGPATGMIYKGGRLRQPLWVNCDMHSINYHHQRLNQYKSTQFCSEESLTSFTVQWQCCSISYISMNLEYFTLICTQYKTICFKSTVPNIGVRTP